MSFIKGLFNKKKTSCCGSLDDSITKAKDDIKNGNEIEKNKEKKCSCSFDLDAEIKKAQGK